MLEHAKERLCELQEHLREAKVDVALLTDESTIAYYAGFWGYLSVEFGRPTFLIVPADGDPVVVTPLMESEMVSAMTWIPESSKGRITSGAWAAFIVTIAIAG